MPSADGLSGFEGENIAGSILDETLSFHGTSLPTAGPNDIPNNGLFLLENIDGVNLPGKYKNTGTKGSPTWLRLTPFEELYGTGADGAATNPTLTAPFDKNYTDLTIDTSDLTITGVGPAIIRCSGTLTIDGVSLIANHTDYISSGKGGISGGGNSADGGNGGTSDGVLFIFAKTIVASGASPTITSTAGVGGAGIDQPNPITNGGQGQDGDASRPWGRSALGGEGGNGSSAGNQVVGGGGLGGGDDSNLSALFKTLGSNILLIRNGGAGGGAGASTAQIASGDSSGSGGGGAGNVIALGGAGGAGQTSNNTPGNGGGGGGAVLIIILTETFDDDLLITPTGGAGGAGAVGVSNGDGGSGGGGGAAGVLLISDIDSTNTTATGGAGGAGGGLSGSGANGNAGGAGGGRKIYVDIDDFKVNY